VFLARSECGRYLDGWNRSVRHHAPYFFLLAMLFCACNSQFFLYRNYAAVAADTFSSELGILSKSKPRLITSLNLRVVPPGTNGGVTATGLAAGLLGSFIVSATSAAVLPFCASAGFKERALWTAALTLWGTLGSVLDSILGGLLQASVVDKRSGKVVEGSGGRKVSSQLGGADHFLTRSNISYFQGLDPSFYGQGNQSRRGHHQSYWQCYHGVIARRSSDKHHRAWSRKPTR
jgi:uncharacterized membrane protein